MVLAGIGTSLLAGSPRLDRRTVRARMLWRAAILLPLGLLLQLLDHGALVILAQYAALFVVALALVFASDRLLLTFTAISATFGPAAWLVGAHAAPEVFTRSATVWGDPIVEILRDLFLTGAFPLVVWAAPFIFGLWLGRRDLARAEVLLRLFALGIGLVVLAWLVSSVATAAFGEPTTTDDHRMLVVRAAHSQMPLWLLSAVGAAMVVLATSLILADRLGRATAPLAAVGRLALTVYAGHLIALHLAPNALTSDTVRGALFLLGVFTIVSWLLAAAWLRRWRYGPLEGVLHLPWILTRWRT